MRICLACHKACGNGGFKKMVKECDKYWSKISKNMLLIFNKLCLGFQKKQHSRKQESLSKAYFVH